MSVSGRKLPSTIVYALSTQCLRINKRDVTRSRSRLTFLCTCVFTLGMSQVSACERNGNRVIIVPLPFERLRRRSIASLKIISRPHIHTHIYIRARRSPFVPSAGSLLHFTDPHLVPGTSKGGSSISRYSNEHAAKSRRLRMHRTTIPR